MSTKEPVKVIAKCPKCRANNPMIEAEQWGENAESIMVIFVAGCCKSIVAPKQEPPLPV
jgi:hypothetical protein